jgi:formimidoylglutamate deiminase
MASPIFYLPEILYAEGEPRAGVGLLAGPDGRVAGVLSEPKLSGHDLPPGTRIVSLPRRALLPGLANAHSHTFQRLFRGRAEGRAAGGDTFWTWREQMYRAAAFVSPDSLYDVARAAFLEMAASGITVVGEFHYLHRDPQGHAYAEPNLLSHQVIAAAQSVGVRICLLRSAYFRAGFEREPHPGQRRFYETSGEYLRNLGELIRTSEGIANVTVGAAPHSIRAVPLPDLISIAEATGGLPLHMHISEQVGENSACQAEYGSTPVTLIAEHGILSRRTALIHAIHLTDSEFGEVARAGAAICSCPTTERNLGDGIFPADTAARLGIPVAFGTDSQAQIGILEDARQLEYHLRLRDQQRGILDGSARPDWKTQAAIGPHLLQAATRNGYAALGINAGALAVGEPADFFTVDLDDLAILGIDPESLAAQAVFAVDRAAVREVAVQGKLIVEDGHHPLEEEIRTRYKAAQRLYASQ